jgi:hypothetical protein
VVLKLPDKIKVFFDAFLTIDPLFWFSVATAILFAAVYVLPTIVAFEGSHPRRLTICVLNILLGWTLLGWILAIVWSVRRKKVDEE